MAESGHPVVHFSDTKKSVDLFILLNGCSHACLEEEVKDKNPFTYISVQGVKVDCRPVAEDGIPEFIFNKILSTIIPSRDLLLQQP